MAWLSTASASAKTARRERRASWIEWVIGFAVLAILFLRFNTYYGSPIRLSAEETALRMASEDAAVTNLLGQPLVLREPASAHTTGTELKIDLPVVGRRGKGTLKLLADRAPTRWIFTRLELFVDDRLSVDILAHRLPYLVMKDFVDTLFAAGLDDVTLPLASPANDGSHPSMAADVGFDAKNTANFNVHVEQSQSTLREDSAVNRFLVDLQSGRFNLQQTDFVIPDSLPVVFARSYLAGDHRDNAFGPGTLNPYDIFPTGTRFPYTEINLDLNNGSSVHFSRISSGTSFEDAVYRHEQTSSEFYRALYFWNGDGWTLRLKNHRKVMFPEAYGAQRPAQGAPTAMEDEAGHRITLERDAQRNLVRIVSPSGRTLFLKYDQTAHLAEIHDESGHARTYTYDSTGHLSGVAEGGRPLYGFGYERLSDLPNQDPFVMTRICGRDGQPILRLVYDASGRVVSETLSDGQTIGYDYSFISQNGRTKQVTTVSQANGKKEAFVF